MEFNWRSFILISLIGTSLNAKADLGFFSENYNTIGLFGLAHSGEKEKSFTENATSVGLETSRVMSSSWLALEFKVRGGYLSGQQKFLDGTTQVSADYTHYFGDVLFGPRLSLLPRRTKGLSFSVAALALGNISYLALEKSGGSFTNLQKNYSSTNGGFEIQITGEWLFSSGNGKPWMIYMNVSQRTLKAKLAEQSQFSLDGFLVSTGIGW